MGYDEEDDDFDYDEFVEREFEEKHRATSVPIHWQVVAMGLVTLFILYLTSGLWTF